MKIKLPDKKNKIITALEISKNWLKVVQAEKSRAQNRICHIEAQKIDSVSDQDLARAIGELSKKLKINSSNLAISVPHTMVSTKYLRLPSTTPSEIEDMVALQASKQSPYSSDEIVKGYRVSGSSVNGYSDVLLVVVHRDVIQRYFKILNAAQLTIEKICFGSEGLLSWKNFSPSSAKKAVILIDIDHDSIDFEFAVEDKAIFNRSVPSGAGEASSAAHLWQDKFVQETMRSIYAYQNKVTDHEVEKIIISATPAVKNGFDGKFLREKIGLPVEIVGQLDNIPKSNEAEESYNNLAMKNLSFAGLIGTALNFGRQEIDLVPDDVKMERSFKERGRDIYRVGMAAVYILIVVSSLFFVRLYNEERYLGQLDLGLSEIQNRSEMLSSMMRETALVKDRLETRGMALDLVYEVHKAILPEMHLVAMAFDGKESLILRGTSESMAEVFNFVSALEESEYFQNVQTRSTQQRKERDKDIISFEILCPLGSNYKNMDKHRL